MQTSKTSKKKQSLSIIQERKPEIKKTGHETNKNNIVKFSRQTQSRVSNPNSVRSSLIVPQLNLIKINAPKLQSPPSKKDQIHHISKKHLNRVDTKETKDPLTSYRNSQDQIQKMKNELKMSPTVSNRLLGSPIQTLLKTKQSKDESESINTEADKQQLLLLQIKQLKRQNTFLKKKIRDLKKDLNGGFLPEEYERKSPSNKQNTPNKFKKGFPKINTESLHLSANLFFEQIRNLLTTVTQLFRIQFTEQQIKQFQSLHSQDQMTQQLNEQICPLRKHQILKKYFLKRKLDRLTFEQEEKRYELLLNIFTEYYSYKEQSEKKVVQTIDNMVMYASDLNKWLIGKAYSKKMKSEIQSQKSTQRQFIAISTAKLQTLKIPSSGINHVIKVKGQTYSPMTKIHKENN